MLGRFAALVLAQAALAAGVLAAAPAPAAPGETAIVVARQAVLRAAPRASAQQQAQLWQGAALEVRGERLDWLQVWDHQRERGGYVRATEVRRLRGTPSDAPELLAVLRFVRETPGNEALGIGLAGAWLQAASPEAVRGESGIDVLDTLGTLSDRLAARASNGAHLSRHAQATAAAHLDVASQYGVRFAAQEVDGIMQVCYEGEAFRRVLALPSAPAQRARAALALTRPECIAPQLMPLQRHEVNLWRSQVLDRVEVAALPGHVRNRLHLRRAAVWSTLAFEAARLGGEPSAAARRALEELAGVHRPDLPEEDQAHYNDAVMRVNAVRWAALPAPPAIRPAGRPTLQVQAGPAGEQCLLLVDRDRGADRPLARRCTHGLVWLQSATGNREANAVTVAVQPLDGWRELWVFRKQSGRWTVSVLPPAAVAPGLGYAEFAGWVPGGRQMLVAREARGEGRYRRSYELVSLDSLAVQRQSSDAAALGAFQRWQDPGWRRLSVGLR